MVIPSIMDIEVKFDSEEIIVTRPGTFGTPLILADLFGLYAPYPQASSLSEFLRGA